MDGEGVFEEITIDAERNGGQEYDGAGFFPGDLAAAASDVGCVKEILSLREMQVVGFDGTGGDDGDLVFTLRDAIEVGGCEVPFVDIAIFVHHKFPAKRLTQIDWDLHNHRQYKE